MKEHTRRIAELLVEAHSNELALINVLEAHESIAEPGNYRTALRAHLRETRDHAERLQRRLDELGYNRSLFAAGYGLVQNVAKQSLVLMKGPIDVLRGGSDVKEKMVRNAMDEVMTEAMEIASYDVLEALARTVGDTATAELAADIRRDEENMLSLLRAEIPALVTDMATQQVAEIDLTVEEPWAGYDDMTVADIKSRLQDASDSLLIAVRRYEERNKNRTTVIGATERESVTV